jgi:hypothetical protein
MQDLVAGQSLAASHMGDASPGVTQKPDWQMDALPQPQHSASVVHEDRQNPPTHIWPEAQSVLARQLGRGRVSARQRPSTQRSPAAQFASDWHAGWQWPLMQVPPLQLELNTHWPPPSGSGWQKPPMQTVPVPQPLSPVQPGSQAPLRQRPFGPHSLLN